MKTHDQQITATLFRNTNDTQVIQAMKEVGVWGSVKRMSIIGGTDFATITPNYVFRWYSLAGDSGYEYYRTTNPLELLEVIVKVSVAIKCSGAEPIEIIH